MIDEKLVYALCEDIQNRHAGESEFERGMRFAAKRIAKETCGVAEPVAPAKTTLAWNPDFLTPAEAYEQGRFDEQAAKGPVPYPDDAPKVAEPVEGAEPMRKHVEDFASSLGWKREDGEGAFEFIQRTSYHQGWADGKREAVGDVHRDSDEDDRKCNVCGGAILYGERHHQCGSAVMKAVKEALAEAAPASAQAGVVPEDAARLEWLEQFRRNVAGVVRIFVAPLR